MNNTQKFCMVLAFCLFALFQRGCIQRWFQSESRPESPPQAEQSRFRPTGGYQPSPDGIHYQLSYFFSSPRPKKTSSVSYFGDESASFHEDLVRYFEETVTWYETVILRMETFLNAREPGMAEPIVCRDDWTEIGAMRKSIATHKELLFDYQNRLRSATRDRDSYHQDKKIQSDKEMREEMERFRRSFGK